jgi:hypothetical protein
MLLCLSEGQSPEHREIIQRGECYWPERKEKRPCWVASSPEFGSRSHGIFRNQVLEQNLQLPTFHPIWNPCKSNTLFCRRPQGESHGALDTSFWNSSERTQQQMQFLTNGVLFLPKGLWSLICLTFFPKYMFFNLPRDVNRSTASSSQTSCLHPMFWDSNIRLK